MYAAQGPAAMDKSLAVAEVRRKDPRYMTEEAPRIILKLRLHGTHLSARCCCFAVRDVQSLFARRRLFVRVLEPLLQKFDLRTELSSLGLKLEQRLILKLEHFVLLSQGRCSFCNPDCRLRCGVT